MVAMPGWVEHAVWWQVYPLGFVGAEKQALAADQPPAHRLPQLIDWLDYAVELGASGLALGPVFTSETHGYDTVDFLSIDTRLGDDADFDALVEAAHTRGLSILLDGVFNHVGRGFAPFQQVLAGGADSPTASMFQLSWPAGARPGAEPEYAEFEGHSQLVALNHEDGAVADLVTEVMLHWLGRGADGWRLDAAYAVPSTFWATVLPRVRAAYPDAYFVGEVIHGDYVAAVHDGELDSVTQYELWKAIWSSLNDGNFYELAHALERHNHYLGSFAPLTFVGNHDVTRLASRLTDIRHLPHAVAVLLTVGGTPSIYAGDEQAFRGIKEERFGGDDAIRPAFPAHPDDLAADGWPTYHLHQLLIGLRRRHPWLHRANFKPMILTNDHLIYTVSADDESLIVALNLSTKPTSHPTPNAESVIAGDGRMDWSGPRAQVHLPAHGWAILEHTPGVV